MKNCTFFLPNITKCDEFPFWPAQLTALTDTMKLVSHCRPVMVVVVVVLVVTTLQSSLSDLDRQTSLSATTVNSYCVICSLLLVGGDHWMVNWLPSLLHVVDFTISASVKVEGPGSAVERNSLKIHT